MSIITNITNCCNKTHAAALFGQGFEYVPPGVSTQIGNNLSIIPSPAVTDFFNKLDPAIGTVSTTGLFVYTAVVDHAVVVGASIYIENTTPSPVADAKIELRIVRNGTFDFPPFFTEYIPAGTPAYSLQGIRKAERMIWLKAGDTISLTVMQTVTPTGTSMEIGGITASVAFAGRA